MKWKEFFNKKLGTQISEIILIQKNQDTSKLWSFKIIWSSTTQFFLNLVQFDDIYLVQSY